jgi:hypothetical protein
MSLTITIDRTEQGRFRALVAEQPRLIIESDDLSDLVEELKQNLDMIVVMPDGGLSLIEAKASSQTDEAAARAEVERAALRHNELDGLIDRYPVPAEWGSEPGWSDAV